MIQIKLDPLGPFSLDASTEFLRGFTPANYRRLSCAGGSVAALSDDGALSLAFTDDRSWQTVAVSVRQRVDGTLQADVAGDADPTVVHHQLARILSVDVDGTGFDQLAGRDRVLARLIRRYPGLRPVCFNSPYEAACWAIIGQRLRITQASAMRSRISEEYGPEILLGDHRLRAFPAPQTLLKLTHIQGLPEIKLRRLHAIAGAALDGILDASALRAVDPLEAMSRLQTLPGIGPFSASLIIIRGAGAPDCFPAEERRLHDSMAAAYSLTKPSVEDLAQIAQVWRPYRSWAAVLFRVDRERTTGEIARGRRVTVTPAQPLVEVAR